MNTQPITAVKRGNTNTPETMDWSKPGCRTRNQHEAVLAHFRRHPAAWVCGNPFRADRPGQKFSCGFAVTYYDPQGRICGIWVRPGSGGVTDYTVDNRGDRSVAALQAAAVIAQYGEFRGR